ncbi:phosphatidate phosphatase LPIN, partial [Lecanoromycetidae sp. Uapishka_2]
MQYVRSLGGSVSKTWNSINPATLSGAIDVIVVEQDDGMPAEQRNYRAFTDDFIGSLACSPFHVRFGKFSLLRPYEKKVEFKVNNVKQDYAMKLGEGGEAFFVFETSDQIPESLQTSPVISPAASPQSLLEQDALSQPTLQEPEYLDLNTYGLSDRKKGAPSRARPVMLDASRAKSDFDSSTTGLATGLATPPETPPANAPTSGDPNRNYAKTLRLTSDQLKGLKLKPGENSMSFSVNRATCQAYMYYWTYDVPIVISDIDGTITKSDALGHVLNMIGRDWTHTGVAKLYRDIVANGYNILYLTSRSVGQADTTRTYLNGVSQEGFKLPKGPVIMSPDRTIAALRREIYLRKPEVFKMACLRDILNLFNHKRDPFYAGFGNRLTDALSYRSVNIPSTRIFTINSNAEVSLDLLTLNKYKNSYVTMRDTVDHFFPPVGLLVTGGGEDFTDYNYWRETPLDIEDFSDSDSEDHNKRNKDKRSIRSEDEGTDGLDDDDDDQDDELAESYLSRDSIDEGGDLVDSILESIEDDDLVARSSLEEDTHDRTPDAEVEVGLATPLAVELGITGQNTTSETQLDRRKAADAIWSAYKAAQVQ